METVQLLMSSISVVDAEMSIHQAESAKKLTLLAFFFIPGSFVTGLFGMNVAEINGSPLPAWVSLVTLLAVLAVTVLLFVGYNWGSSWAGFQTYRAHHSTRAIVRTGIKNFGKWPASEKEGLGGVRTYKPDTNLDRTRMS